MESSELRIGNLVLAKGEFDKGFKIIQVKSILSDGINIHDYRYGVDYMFYEGGGSIESVKPVPLTEEWLGKMKDNKNKTAFPDWIEYVHEAQNWYYWNNNKEELKIKL